ncbi:hypothetical protein L1049_016887 [Liquidambar formosana]|uniref:Uncharacterized protein n=1 Tax=Liquidambar formosana TaxID=63359 RepID=A0AAP0X7U2_LIQFO
MKRNLLSECGGCSSGERLLLHNVRHRGTYRRLCTACVLKNHPGSFCPICFHVFDELPPANERVICLKCPSISHLACVGFDVANRYECPPCANPNFAFFDVRVLNASIKGIDGESAANETKRGINKDSARALLAAARIASTSMSKAAAVARVEAERRVKEAALAKKRAREALERVAYLVSKEKEKNKDSKAAAVAMVDNVVSPQKGIQNRVKVEVPASLGEVGLTGIQKRVGFQAKDTVLRPPSNGISVEGN